MQSQTMPGYREPDGAAMPAHVTVETRLITRPGEISGNLADELAKRLRFGKAVVLTDTPASFLSAVRKQWKRHEALALRAFSSTLKREALQGQLIIYSAARFTCNKPAVDNTADVLF